MTKGSSQSIGIEPGPGFEAPPMALDDPRERTAYIIETGGLCGFFKVDAIRELERLGIIRHKFDDHNELTQSLERTYWLTDATACGYCGAILRNDDGYTGAAAYHRDCARRVYGDDFEETKR